MCGVDFPNGHSLAASRVREENQAKCEYAYTSKEETVHTPSSLDPSWDPSGWSKVYASMELLWLELCQPGKRPLDMTLLTVRRERDMCTPYQDLVLPAEP